MRLARLDRFGQQNTQAAVGSMGDLMDGQLEVRD